MAYRKPKGDVSWYRHNKKYKRPIAYSTVATEEFLIMIHEMYPDEDILSLWARLCDKKQWIYNPEEVAVLESYIEKNEGNVVPNFGYNAWITTNPDNSSNPMDWKRVRAK